MPHRKFQTAKNHRDRRFAEQRPLRCPSCALLEDLLGIGAWAITASSIGGLASVNQTQKTKTSERTSSSKLQIRYPTGGDLQDHQREACSQYISHRGLRAVMAQTKLSQRSVDVVSLELGHGVEDRVKRPYDRRSRTQLQDKVRRRLLEAENNELAIIPRTRNPMSSTTSPTPRVVVVGCGQWGQNLIRNFAGLEVLEAVVDSNPVKAEDSAQQLSAQGHDQVRTPDWESALIDTSISAIVLATPAPQHAEMAIAALNSGKHVFIEKPLALTMMDGELIQAAVHKSGKIAMVGHSFQYHPAFLKLKTLIHQGELGRLMHIHSRRLGFGRIRHEEDVFWNLAPHDISMILALVGQSPTNIEAQGIRHLRPHIADVASANLTFANGATAHVMVSWIYPQKERKMIVVGERAMAVFDDCEPWENKLRVYQYRIDWASGFPETQKDSSESQMVSLESREPVAEECRHFLECIRTGQNPLTSIEEAMPVVRVLCTVGEILRQQQQPMAISNLEPTPTSTSPRAPEMFPLIDLAAQKVKIQASLRERFAAVFQHMEFIMGPEVLELEGRLCEFSGAAHAVTCASGTDALTLALLALGLRKGDAVLVPSFTFVATVEPVVLLGGVPIFIDVDESLTINPALISDGVDTALGLGLRPVGMIAVDIFGHPANYQALRTAANATAGKLWIIADAAQSFGASVDGCRVGTLADITTTSFFPSKPLGCYGDGGAVFTDDPEIASVLRSLRLHGRGDEKFDNIRVGLNSRLDSLQAAVLLCKLEIFEDELASRQRIASRYTSILLGSSARPLILREGVVSAWASYTVRTTARAMLQTRLKEQGISSCIYYPRAIHKQAAYQAYPVANGSCDVAELACTEVLTIPMHPYLEAKAQDRILAVMTQGQSR
ncbi:DegT/DnrJ/EryC1/StrS aminotransferase family-domain-containing protein [Cadophora sp. MPI-SDFR-AT-0126]|nr:DegT/DnrJ/EryC1/StrS aminotransferase family-domain-containing protein [Leotiomycetes sp. MPI-SDFR-AT-0126]